MRKDIIYKKFKRKLLFLMEFICIFYKFIYHWHPCNCQRRFLQRCTSYFLLCYCLLNDIVSPTMFWINFFYTLCIYSFVFIIKTRHNRSGIILITFIVILSVHKNETKYGIQNSSVFYSCTDCNWLIIINQSYW